MIAAVPVGMSVEIEGLDGLRQRIEARIREQAGADTEIAVVTGGTRGATKNALIAKVQAARLRNPFYLNGKALALIKAAAPALFSIGSNAKLAAEAIGNAMLISIQENVSAQKNPDGGTFTGLTTGYARRKQAKWGFVRPVLRASGDLLGGLLVRVTRSGER